MYRTSAAHTGETAKISRMLSAGVAIALGMIVLFGMGFAGPEILHNAAHDVRHGFAFPCH
jgi:cobalt transporter subunit CbtB